MKLLFFTPIINTSAIAYISNLVVDNLMTLGHDIQVVSTETDNFNEQSVHDSLKNNICWRNSDKLLTLFSQFDLAIYQIGDNGALHHGCLHWMTQFPGVICLHDYCIFNLFKYWAKQNRLSNRCIWKYIKAYSSSQYIEIYKSLTTRIFTRRMLHETISMTEWISSQAMGVLTHSSWRINSVLESCPGAVTVAPLPYVGKKIHQLANTSPQDKLLEKKSKEEVILLTFGHMNTNKRMAEIIKTIGANDFLRKRVIYHLVGSISLYMKKKLTKLANKLAVRLVISGGVSDAWLEKAIKESDIVCCLRNPVLEAASLSVIEAMYFAKPVIVSNHGFYGELPDDCVYKISVNKEQADLNQALSKLIQSKNTRDILATKACHYAHKTFTITGYSKALLDLCEKTVLDMPVLNGIEGITKSIANWRDIDDKLPLQDLSNRLKLFKSLHHNSE